MEIIHPKKQVAFEDIAKMFPPRPDSTLTVSEIQQLHELLFKYAHLFASDEYDVGTNTEEVMRIDTGEHPRPKKAVIPFSQRPAVEKILEKMVKNGIIEPSHSPWAWPLLTVPKKDGGIRIVIDYRALNAITVRDAHPMPSIPELLLKFKKCKFFSKTDLNAGFYNIYIHPSDREKTAFLALDKHFQFIRMGMGLTNAPASMMRLAELIIATMGNFGSAFMDDLAWSSETFPEHLDHTERALLALHQHGVKLKPSKCEFASEVLNILGHTVTGTGIHIDQSKTDVIAKFPAPKSAKQAMAVHGFFNYYRRFIKNFTFIVKPILETFRMHGKIKFVWSEKCQQALDTLKSELLADPILIYPDLNKEMVLYTDACDFGIGAELSQAVDGIMRPIAFASRTLAKHEIHWSVTEKEAYAVVWAIKHFRTYLYGTRFSVVTDHTALKILEKGRSENRRLERWSDTSKNIILKLSIVLARNMLMLTF